MTWKVQGTSGGKYRVELVDMPYFVHAFESSPNALEFELTSGLWLFVTFAVWSIQAHASVESAVEFTVSNGGRFHLGIRPFHDYDEVGRWWPAKDLITEHPLTLQKISSELRINAAPGSGVYWLVLDEGKLRYQGTGLRSRRELEAMMG